MRSDFQDTIESVDYPDTWISDNEYSEMVVEFRAGIHAAQTIEDYKLIESDVFAAYSLSVLEHKDYADLSLRLYEVRQRFHVDPFDL